MPTFTVSESTPCKLINLYVFMLSHLVTIARFSTLLLFSVSIKYGNIMNAFINLLHCTLALTRREKFYFSFYDEKKID